MKLIVLETIQSKYSTSVTHSKLDAILIYIYLCDMSQNRTAKDATHEF
jgi:hypothetical protein